MAFRSHIGRPFDLTLWSNRLLFLSVTLFGLAAVVAWGNDSPIEVLWAPAHVFVIWALVRELDPDHDWSALLAAALAGVWVLLGYPMVSALAVGGLLLAARLILNSTGRRPLITDLVVVGGYAAAIAFTRVGWVSGFGLAVAILIDARMTEEAGTAGTITAGLAALGATLVATAAGAFPGDAFGVQPMAVTLIGLVALVTILRAPPEPTSLVDSRMKWSLSRDRLHGARSLTGILVFASALLSGGEVDRLVPVVIALVISLMSAEVERLRRPR
jgi:hypothetical protein